MLAARRWTRLPVAMMQRIWTRPGKLCRKVCVLGQGRGRDRRLVGAVPLIIGYTGYNIIVSGHISWFILVSAGNFHGYRSYTYIHACMHCMTWHDITLHYIYITITFTFNIYIYITLHYMYACIHVCIYIYISIKNPLAAPPSMMVDDSGRVQPALCSSKQAAWTKRDLQFMKTFIVLRF